MLFQKSAKVDIQGIAIIAAGVSVACGIACWLFSMMAVNTCCVTIGNTGGVSHSPDDFFDRNGLPYPTSEDDRTLYERERVFIP
jgi:hypothetical protein